MASSPVQSSSPIWPSGNQPAPAPVLAFNPEPITFADRTTIMNARMTNTYEGMKEVIEKMVSNWGKAQLQYSDKQEWSHSELVDAIGLNQVELQALFLIGGLSTMGIISLRSVEINQAFLEIKKTFHIN